MGTIVTSGVGSGLDIASLVSQLVQAEGQPAAVRLDVEEARLQGKISALATLRSALATFRDAVAELKDLDSFRGRQVSLSSPDFVSATAAANVNPSSYQIEVERLASAHRLNSQAFASQDDVIGTGTLALSLGGSAFTVDIDASNNTVAGIAEAINGASENTGITANVINGVDGTRLVLSASETGADNTIVVTESGGDGGLSVLVYDPVNAITNLTELTPALDARALIDGFAVESSTNSVSGAVTGMTFELLGQNEVGVTTTVAVSFDRESARELVGKLVEGYNALIDAIAGTASFNPETGESGPLFGDSGLRNVSFQLRRELNDSVTGLDGPFSLLQQIGVETALDGRLSIDATRLDAAFDTDFDAVGQLFADAEQGLAHRLDQRLEAYLGSDGLLDGRDTSLKASVDEIGDRREALQARLVALEARLSRQFNALDGLLAQLQSTSNFLSQQLASLPGVVLFNRDN